ncbi:hypothetical protein [Paenibacillus terrigena]|uniref:hypothetical protein n=1 Tax=Paenibacillus terrigena TaxID=369333 RepID=UPI0028D59AC2|nr:hypothetical protein [Paenibacillus terrigena]
MIPFENTWPFEQIMNDIYIHACPFCSKENVLLPLKPKELQDIHEGKKKLLVFPCCSHRVTLVDMDHDYLLASEPLRGRR